MNPVAGDVHVNSALTSISVAYMQRAENFVATQAFPNIPVQKQSDRYFVFDRGDFNRDEAQERAPGTESAGGSYTLDNTPSYFCRTWSFHKDIPDEIRANSDAPLNNDRAATKFVTLKDLIRKEKVFKTNFMTSGKWTNDYAGVSGSPSANQVKHWSDIASTPIEDVRFAKRTVAESTGFEPNTLILGRGVADALVDHPDIVDRVKYGTQSQVSIVGIPELQALFKIQRILVMNAIENTAEQGLTNVHSFIGGKTALLCYSAPEPEIEMPSAGYTFSWTGKMGASALGGRIRSFRMEHLDSDRIEIDSSWDMKLIGADLGFFWDSVIA